MPFTGSYSVSLFARETTFRPLVEFISQGGAGGDFYIGHAEVTTGLNTIRVSGQWSLTGIQAQTDGLQHHYAVVVDAAANQTRLYIDGALRTTLATAIASAGGTNATRLGRQYDGCCDEHLEGSLSDVRIYSGALADQEVAALAGVSSVAAPVPPELSQTPLSADSSLISYYRFEGNSSDSKNTNNGVPTNISYLGGKFGQAAGFDGTSSFISLGSGVSLPYPFTIHSWIYLSSPLQTGVLFGNNDAGNGASIYIQINASGQISCSNFVTEIDSSNWAVGPGAWYMVDYTNDANTGKLYLNGNLIFFGPIGHSPSTENAVIGRHPTLNTNFFRGMIDDYAIFGRVLTDSEIASLYPQPGSAPSTGTITIRSNLSQATFSISPPIPNTPTGGPYPRIIPNVPFGTYTVTFNALPRYILAQPVQTSTVSANLNPIYLGSYVPILLTASSTHLTFSYNLGDPPPESQSITVGSNIPANLPLSVTTTSAGGWLSENVAGGGATPTTITVKLVPVTTLRPGNITGWITITSTVALYSPIVVEVDLQVTANPIVLVHGYCETPDAFGKMAALLTDLGFHVYSYNYSNLTSIGTGPDHSIEEIAYNFGRYVDQTVRPAEGARRIIVVAHSEGGAVARSWMVGLVNNPLWLQVWPYTGQISAIATVGTPHYGQAIGVGIPAIPFVANGCSQIQPTELAYGSDFISRLHDQWGVFQAGPEALSSQKMLFVAGTHGDGAIGSPECSAPPVDLSAALLKGTPCNDGLVDVDSAALPSATVVMNIRYVPYVHCDSTPCKLFLGGGKGEADIDNASHKTFQTIRQWLVTGAPIDQCCGNGTVDYTPSFLSNSSRSRGLLLLRFLDQQTSRPIPNLLLTSASFNPSLSSPPTAFTNVSSITIVLPSPDTFDVTLKFVGYKPVTVHVAIAFGKPTVPSSIMLTHQ